MKWLKRFSERLPKLASVALIKPIVAGFIGVAARQGTELLAAFWGNRVFLRLKETGFASALADALFAKRRGGAKTRSGQLP